MYRQSALGGTDAEFVIVHCVGMACFLLLMLFTVRLACRCSWRSWPHLPGINSLRIKISALLGRFRHIIHMTALVDEETRQVWELADTWRLQRARRAVRWMLYLTMPMLVDIAHRCYYFQYKSDQPIRDVRNALHDSEMLSVVFISAMGMLIDTVGGRITVRALDCFSIIGTAFVAFKLHLLSFENFWYNEGSLLWPWLMFNGIVFGNARLLTVLNVIVAVSDHFAFKRAAWGWGWDGGGHHINADTNLYRLVAASFAASGVAWIIDLTTLAEARAIRSNGFTCSYTASQR